MPTIREFAPPDAAAVSALIRYTMQMSNSSDYPLARLQPLIDYFSPAKVLQLSEERHCLVAEMPNAPTGTPTIVGTIAIEGTELCTFFVHPDYQKMGIGTQLLQAIENVAMANRIHTLHMDASLTGEPFYRKMGYQRTGLEKEGTAGKQIGMEKTLGSTTNI